MYANIAHEILFQFYVSVAVAALTFALSHGELCLFAIRWDILYNVYIVVHITSFYKYEMVK